MIKPSDRIPHDDCRKTQRIPETAAEELRRIVSYLDTNREGINDLYDLEELIQLVRASWRSGWDWYFDQWTEKQRREALRGVVPQWDPKTEKPTKGIHWSKLP